MLNNVPIARKLALLCAVFLIPVILLAWLLLDHSGKAINFARKEIDGTVYIDSITDAIDPLTRGHWEALNADGDNLGPTISAALKKADSLIDSSEQRFGATMLSSAQAATARQGLSAYMASGQQGAQFGAESHLAALKALRDLVSRVGDHSNLILDPDLDSYYVMDLVVLRMPTLITNLEKATAVLWTMRAATPIDQQRFMDLLARARSTVESMEGAITIAVENNDGGQLAASLRPSFLKAADSINAYIRTLELTARMVQGGLDFDRSDIISSHTVMQSAVIQLWKDGLSSLTVLLEARISSLRTELWASLSASILALCLAGVLAAMIARGISRPLSELQRLMARLADGETGISVPARGRQDEVGQMAKALDVFRENAVRTHRMKAALDCVGTPVLVVSSDGTLTDMNNAARQHFHSHSAAISSDIKGFSLTDALGTPIRQVFPKPAFHDMLSNCPQGAQRGQIDLGSRSFDVRVNTVTTERGEHLGMVCEWIDLSERLRMERDIARLVDCGISGDFSQRLDVDSQRGFLRSLAERMNNFVDTVSESLGELVEVNGVLAQGDLMRRIDRPYEGAFQALADNTNQMADRLADIVRKIAESAHAVHNASAEIAQGSEDLATRTEQQAANLEETAAAMEELAVTVRQNAHSAQQADELASEARLAAEKGGRIVGPAVTAMGRIEESSGKISEITTVIEEIAFQTNLLALNAAVEAARAGDAGRGFAVVAAEVRQLAQRTSRSSKEIKELIQRSNVQVQDGVKMVGEVGRALEGIVESITSVAAIIGEIASASREQSSGLDEVNAAVTQMDEMTQQNAALVEETTAAAHSLSVQAEALVDLVSYFRVDDHHTPSHGYSYGWQGTSGWQDADVEDVHHLSHRPRPGLNRPQATAPARPMMSAPGLSRPVAVTRQRPPAPRPSAPHHPGFEQDADWSEF